MLSACPAVASSSCMRPCSSLNSFHVLMVRPLKLTILSPAIIPALAAGEPGIMLSTIDGCRVCTKGGTSLIIESMLSSPGMFMVISLPSRSTVALFASESARYTSLTLSALSKLVNLVLSVPNSMSPSRKPSFFAVSLNFIP